MIDRFLLSFVELARAPYLRQLAARMHVTPATLSLRIKGLEESLGVQLFKNEGQKLSLTPEGKRLLPIAEAILNSYSELSSVAKNLSRDSSRVIRIGVIESVAHTFLTNLMATFASELPELKVELSLDLTRNLSERLLAGDVDLIICVGDSLYSPHLVVDDLVVFPVHWVVNRGGGLADAPIEQVLQQRLFTQMINTAPYHAVVALLNSLQTQLDLGSGKVSAIGAPSLAVLVAMARQSLGISIMPGIFAKEFIDAGELECLALPSPRPSLVSQCHHVNPSAVTLSAARLVQKVCAEYVRTHQASGYVLAPGAQMPGDEASHG